MPKLDAILWTKIGANSKIGLSKFLDTNDQSVDAQNEICDNTVLSACNAIAEEFDGKEYNPVWDVFLEYESIDLKALNRKA